MPVTVIKPQELAAIRTKGQRIDLIDVRTPLEYREVHVEHAQNVPLHHLNPKAVMQARGGASDEPLYLICRSGTRGQQACQKFLDAGFTNVINVEGGTMACVDAGLPIVRKKVISLQRQVQICAGLLTLLGVALSPFHPAFIGLAAFIGAGLVFSGITDTCPMAMALARMPWNQAGKESATNKPTSSCCTR